MRSALSLVLSILVAIVLVWAAFKLLGLALKGIGIAVVVALAVGLYFGAQKLIGKS